MTPVAGPWTCRRECATVVLMATPSDRDDLDGAKRYIPEDVKREVRQRCGFGCISCGSPVYEYHHMIEWATTRRHDPDEITLLCPTEHKEATGPNASLPSSVVREFDSNPKTFVSGKSSLRKLYYRGDVSVIVGGITARRSGSSFTALTIGGEKVVWIDVDDGAPLLNAHIWDSRGSTLLRIRKGEWTYATSPWDITYISNVLTMREARGAFLLEVRFAAPDVFAVDRGVFYGGATETIVTPGVININGNSYGECGSFENRGSAVAIGGNNSTLLKAVAGGLVR